MNDNPLIIALDVESAGQARAIVRKLTHHVRFFKVGLELFTAAGPELVNEFVAEGNQVFLDLKLYDIGQTVTRAVAQVARMGARFLTVHAVPQVMLAAMQGRTGSELHILGVTVLTSFDNADLLADGYEKSVDDLVQLRVRNAVAAGVAGIVCSPLEVAAVRNITGPDMVLVTPGVRSAGADPGDQKRIATPRQAMAEGASYLVIGRQVTNSPDPGGEVKKILEEIAG
ncbi:MAG: orotidine-5'-phosphate decarboxylase [Bryobacteraceae bacterium]|nr:orotidine-5'-phosphate decarboxylase [Bryobacteraceae bacterium]